MGGCQGGRRDLKRERDDGVNVGWRCVEISQRDKRGMRNGCYINSK